MVSPEKWGKYYLRDLKCSLKVFEVIWPLTFNTTEKKVLFQTTTTHLLTSHSITALQTVILPDWWRDPAVKWNSAITHFYYLPKVINDKRAYCPSRTDVSHARTVCVTQYNPEPCDFFMIYYLTVYFTYLKYSMYIQCDCYFSLSKCNFIIFKCPKWTSEAFTSHLQPF